MESLKYLFIYICVCVCVYFCVCVCVYHLTTSESALPLKYTFYPYVFPGGMHALLH